MYKGPGAGGGGRSRSCAPLPPGSCPLLAVKGETEGRSLVLRAVCSTLCAVFVLEVHVLSRGVGRRAMHTMLVVHPSAAPCVLFLVPPPRPHQLALLALRGEGGGRLQWGCGCLPPYTSSAARMLPKTSRSLGSVAAYGEGGGGLMLPLA